MTIGIVSHISAGVLTEYLYDEYKDYCTNLSKDYAPAVTTLAKEFLDVGHELVIFTLDPKATKELILYGPNVTIYVAPSNPRNKFLRFLSPLLGRNLRTINRLLKRNKKKLDVISVHWTREYAISVRKLIKEIPVFVTVRDIIPYIVKTQKLSIKNYKWGIIYLMNEFVMRNKGYRFIANSQYTANSIKKYWGKNAPVIPNPTLDKYFDIPYEANNNDDIHELSTISISQPDDKRKNIPTLLKAFQIVHKKHKNARLNIIGQSFTQDNPIIQQYQEQGLLEGVKLKGTMPHDDVLKFLSHSHIMVHPSLEETFGNTLIEAMAVGCPVIGGYKSGAVPFVLDNGNAGYLCDVESSEELANTIIKVLNSPNERERISKAAYEYCKKNYSSKNIALRYLDIFNKAIESK